MNSAFLMAVNELGVTEYKGSNHNDQVMKYFHDIGHNWVKNDETAWCSAFVNWCCQVTGYENSGKLNARSWLNVGEETKTPQKGDIVVFWRSSPTSWKGHVAFYVYEDEQNIYVLGGNQSNKVCIKPYSKKRLLSYRRIKQVF